MEKVLEQARTEYADEVNVKLYNVLKSEGQNLMKMYGIAAIPTQVLLDENGKEFFRHTGFISLVVKRGICPMLTGHHCL